MVVPATLEIILTSRRERKTRGGLLPAARYKLSPPLRRRVRLSLDSVHSRVVNTEQMARGRSLQASGCCPVFIPKMTTGRIEAKRIGSTSR